MSVTTKELTISHTDLATLDFALTFFEDDEGTIPSDLSGAIITSELYDKLRTELLGVFDITEVTSNSYYFKLNLPPENVLKLRNTLVFDVRITYPTRVDYPLRVFVNCEKGYTGFSSIVPPDEETP
jgi:hypothetical protein